MRLRTLFAVACAAFMAMPAYAELKTFANVETNTDVKTTSVDSGSSTTDKTAFENGGRVEFGFNGRAENEAGYFAAGKGCAEIKIGGGLTECDVWFSLGTPSVALKVGHWEAENLFSKGQDIYLIEVPGAVKRYQANAARGRGPNGAGVVLNLGKALKLDTKISYDSGKIGNVDANKMGVRPVVIYNASGIKVKAGAEYLMATPQNGDDLGEETTLGFGLDTSATFGNITVGAAGAMKTEGGKKVIETKDAEGNVISTKEVDKDDVATTSAAGYLTFNNIAGKDSAGLGAGYTTEDVHDSSHMYVFGSYAHNLPVEGAAVKFGVSYATAADMGGSNDGSAFGARVRFNYAF